jgi:hypothetical protein
MKGRKPEAKSLSLWAIVSGGVWVAAHSVLMALWPHWNERPYGLNMKDIIWSGTFLIISWSPVYGSIWIDKFLRRKLDVLSQTKEGQCV